MFFLHNKPTKLVSEKKEFAAHLGSQRDTQPAPSLWPAAAPSPLEQETLGQQASIQRVKRAVTKQKAADLHLPRRKMVSWDQIVVPFVGF